MNNQNLHFQGDNLCLTVRTSGNIGQMYLVMNKEIFQECYKRWIKDDSKISKECLDKIMFKIKSKSCHFEGMKNGQFIDINDVAAILNEELVGKQLSEIYDDESATKALERSTGHLVYDDHYILNTCSKCRYEIHSKIKNYCPNCGAKIVERENV